MGSCPVETLVARHRNDRRDAFDPAVLEADAEPLPMPPNGDPDRRHHHRRGQPDTVMIVTGDTDTAILEPAQTARSPRPSRRPKTRHERRLLVAAE